MRTLCTVFIVVCCVVCSSYLPYSQAASDAGEVKIPFLDSLIKYDTTNGVVRVDATPDFLNWQLLIATINNIKVGIINHPTDYLYVYKKMGNKWFATDSSFGYSNYADKYSITDINGDGVADIKLVFHVMRGNELSTVLLFDKKDSIFRHSSTFNLMNIGYDKASGLVRSSVLGGTFDNSKTLYRIVADTLQFYKRVAMEINAADTHGELKYYKSGNAGEEILERTLHLRCNKIVRRFDKGLWRDNYGYYFQADTCY